VIFARLKSKNIFGQRLAKSGTQSFEVCKARRS